MHTVKKIVWAEGMFLRPQHFQAQDHYFESSLQQKTQAISSFDWGFTQLTINQPLLMQGSIVIESASGFMPDGTPFSIEKKQLRIADSSFKVNSENNLVYLAVPTSSADIPEVSFEADKNFSKYYVVNEKVSDINSVNTSPVEIQYAQLQIELTLDNQKNHALTYLPLAKISEIKSNGQIVLDPEFIPPTLHGQANKAIKQTLDEVQGLLTQRAVMLAQRLSGFDIDNHVGFFEFLMLQTINRYAPIFQHLCGSTRTHPERIYEYLCLLAGDISIFTENKLTKQLPAYYHNQLDQSFSPLLAYIRDALLVVIDQKAVQIPFTDEKHGVKIAKINDRNLLTQAEFVISVYADMPAEHLRTNFLSQAKFSPIDRISDLVNLQLPGLILSPLGAAPRQIPYAAGRHYFQLDTSSDLWSQMGSTATLAVHIAGNFPGLKLECWALRS